MRPLFVAELDQERNHSPFLQEVLRVLQLAHRGVDVRHLEGVERPLVHTSLVGSVHPLVGVRVVCDAWVVAGVGPQSWCFEVVESLDEVSAGFLSLFVLLDFELVDVADGRSVSWVPHPVNSFLVSLIP